jgi:hypothetical protein
MASPLYTMRALANPGPGYVTWQYGYPDYAGTHAPSAILAGTAVVVSGEVPLGGLGKLDTTHSPVGLWLFSANLNDSSGNGFNLTGTPRGYTYPVEDVLYGAIFENAAWTKTTEASLIITGAVTVQVFGVFQLDGVNSQYLVSFGSNGELSANNRLYDFRIGSDLSLGMFWENGSGSNNSISGTAAMVPIGIPAHLVATRSGAANPVVNFYVNGVSAGGGVVANAASGGGSASSFLSIGDNSEAPGALSITRPGTLFYCVKITPSELTESQVKAEYNRVLGGRGIVYPRL